MDSHSGRQDPHTDQVVRVAQLRAFLIGGASFDLVPIEAERDVKSAVESLLRSWAESGFLIHGRFIYPWHQVRNIEVIQVEETRRPHEESSAAGRVHAQDEFWRTRH